MSDERSDLDLEVEQALGEVSASTSTRATLQDREQGRRTPDQAARVLLTVIDREPDAVTRALAE